MEEEEHGDRESERKVEVENDGEMREGGCHMTFTVHSDIHCSNQPT